VVSVRKVIVGNGGKKNLRGGGGKLKKRTPRFMTGFHNGKKAEGDIEEGEKKRGEGGQKRKGIWERKSGKM